MPHSPPTPPPLAVTAEALHKSFGATHALRGLDLAIPAGTVCGLLGPNGAGKSTVTRVLATLTRPDAGTATVAGYDVVREADDVRRSIGLVAQHAAVDGRLTGRENLRLYGRLHHLGRRTAHRRTDEVLERFDLTEFADRRVAEVSGGQRRRLDIAAALITTPAVLFLDEPTTGLDPASRLAIWDHVRQLADAGTTVLLTTQYLDEADRLADRILVIDHGTAVAEGTPDLLKAEFGLRASIHLDPGADLAAAAAALRAAAGAAASGEVEVDAEGGTLTAVLDAATAPTLPQLLRGLEERGVVARDAAVRAPTLDEAFLRLTGPSDRPGASERPTLEGVVR